MKLTLLMMASWLGQGCAAKKLAVKNADTIIEHKITKIYPANSEQKVKLAKAIDAFLNDSKTVGTNLKETIDEIDPSKPAELEAAFAKISPIYLNLAGKFHKILSHHLASLTPEQQTELFENLADENKKLSAKTPDVRFNDQVVRLEHVLGSATEAQRRILKDNKDFFTTQAQERLKRRQELMEKIKQIYADVKSPEDRESAFHVAHMAFTTETVNKRDYLDIIKKLQASLSPAQVTHIKTQVQEFKELIDYFMAVKY